MNRMARVVVAICALMMCAALASAQEAARVKPTADNSFSSKRLERITQFFQTEVDKKAIPGVAVLVSRNGNVVYERAIGFQDREKNLPMKTDAIFRIASMTKPLTSVAVMMLAEEGKIDLLAPVAQYLPEFKDVKRSMTVQDLLRHTSGLVYGPFGNTLVHQAYNKANLFDSAETLAEFVTKLSKLPLAHQPGAVWEYGMNTDVLGRIVEVVSGMPFDQFLSERITKPLGMKDTAFYLAPQQMARVAEPQVDPATGKRSPASSVENLTKEKVKWFSGGGGLLSTVDDYSRFCQMLQNGGELNGVRLLSPKTIAVMTSDQLAPGVALSGFEDLAPTAEIAQSFGLGFAIRTKLGPNPLDGSVGDYFWAGYHGTYFWVDSEKKIFVVFMVQMPFEQAGPYRRALRELVYGAMVN